MKRLFHILIAAIFIFNMMGYFVVFQVMQYKAKKDIKKAIKAKLPDSELTIITVTAENQDELNWVEDGNEFKYHNMMFDIVKKIQKGNTIYYYCINDTQEKELFSNLNEHIDNHVKNDLSSNKNTKSVLKKVIKDYLFITIFSFKETITVEISYTNKTESINSIAPEILTPPPKFFS